MDLCNPPEVTDNRNHRCRGQPWKTICLTDGLGAVPGKNINAFSRQPADCGVIGFRRNDELFIPAERVDISLLAVDIAAVPAIYLQLVMERGINFTKLRPESQQIRHFYAIS